MPRRLPVIRTTSIRRLSRAELERGRVEYPEQFDRPRTRGECENSPRPCPFVGCRYHLYLDVNPRSGSIKINHLIELEEMADTCALDVASRGEHTLEQVAEHMDLTRERIRQIETKMFEGMRKDRELQKHAEELEG